MGGVRHTLHIRHNRKAARRDLVASFAGSDWLLHGFGIRMLFGPTISILAIAPLFHGAGFNFAHAAVFFGGTCEILPNFDPEITIRKLHEERSGRHVHGADASSTPSSRSKNRCWTAGAAAP